MTTILDHPDLESELARLRALTALIESMTARVNQTAVAATRVALECSEELHALGDQNGEWRALATLAERLSARMARIGDLVSSCSADLDTARHDCAALDGIFAAGAASHERK